MKNTEPTLPPIAALLHQARVATNGKDWDKLKKVIQKMQEFVDAKKTDDVPYCTWR